MFPEYEKYTQRMHDNENKHSSLKKCKLHARIYVE